MLGPELPEQLQGFPWPEDTYQASSLVRSISLEKNSKGYTWKVSVDGATSAKEALDAIEEMEQAMGLRYGRPEGF
jgi:hypothetical protein